MHDLGARDPAEPTRALNLADEFAGLRFPVAVFDPDRLALRGVSEGFEPAESIANSYASLSSPQFVTTVVTTTLRYCATNPLSITSECRMVQLVLGAHRDALLRTRSDGELSNEVMNRILRELDPEEARLEI